jgi:predicted RecA/RadA family phage recombinase
MNADARDASTAPWTAIAIHRDDNVAVALADLAAGARVDVRRGGAVVELVAREPIAFGHKLALVALAPGDVVRKYGEPIGVATAAVPRGGHVHVHNLASLRAKAGR